MNSKIEQLLQERNVSAYKLAQDLGFSSGLISQWRKGLQKPSVEALHKIADYFNVSVDYLLGRPTVAFDESAALTKIGAFSANGKFSIPLLGRVVAGVPLLAEENLEGYIFVDYAPPDEYFALKVFGDSMINDGIRDGSIVVVHKQATAESGDTVVVLINGDEATVKNLKITKDGTMFLMPANDKYEPILLTPQSDAQILGVVIEVRTEWKKKR